MEEEHVFEIIPSLSSGWYYTYIQPVAHVAYKTILSVMIYMELNLLNHQILCVHLVLYVI